MKLVNVDEMRAIEREADARGWTYANMMEAAGSGLAEIVHSFYGYVNEVPSALALVGAGNNGGDALVALTLLADAGWKATAICALPRPVADPLVDRARKAGVEIIQPEVYDYAQIDGLLKSSTVLLDGLFGTGVRLPLSGYPADLLAHIKASPFCPPVVAVDCPSGVDCDTGAAAPQTLQAEVTVCMAAVKTGLLRMPAYKLCGEFQVVDIGLPAHLPAWDAVLRETVDDETVRALLPERPADAHKGTFGTAAVCAGSIQYSGAALLAGRAAARSGVGLVRMAVPAPLHAVLAGHLPEAVWSLLPHRMGAISPDAAPILVETVEKADALLIGPGLGQDAPTAEWLRVLIEGDYPAPHHAALGFIPNLPSDHEQARRSKLPPLIIDADGLRLLARISTWWEKLPAPAVLTPHPGEMAALTGLTISEIQADRPGCASRFAAQWGHVVVLKGAFSMIASPDGRLAVIPVASSALAHAGSGDVLAGIITSLRAQGLPAFEAALCGAWLHARAGLAAEEKVGHEASVLAGDLIEAIPDALALIG